MAYEEVDAVRDQNDQSEPPAKKAEKKSDAKRRARILEEAKKRFKMCEEAEKDLRKIALDDLKFRAGDQWPEEIARQRQADKKPCLTINIIPSRERQILNDGRQNEKAIKVHPVNDDADPKTAEILQGVIRHIEDDSNGKAAWDTGRAFQVRIGFGYIRLVTEYEDPDSFDQVIKIKRILNPFMVYMDPTCQEPDYSDAEYGFIFETLTPEEYKDQYPDSTAASLDMWESIGAHDPDWITEDGIRICEYFYRDKEKDKLLKIRNRKGEERTVLESQLPDGWEKRVKVISERETEIPTLRWCKFNASEILEETDWLGKWVPIIPILGDELNVDGKRTLEGMVRHAKEAVRMNNYMASALVQAIGIAPQAPFMIAEGQIEGHEKEWQQANTRTDAALVYKPQSVGGTAVPPPQRITSEPPIQAIAEARAMFGQDIKDITGIYDAQLGNRSNEVSGRSIEARKVQGELSNLHFADNESTARRCLGRQLLDLIPKVYSAPRVLRIIGEDGTAKTVQVNQAFDDGGVQRIYDLKAGRYAVTVSDGPSYQTKRQEASESMLDMVKSYPQLMQIAGDLLVRNLDFPGADQLADRIKRTLPPELQDQGDQSPESQLAQAQSKLQALMQQHEALTQTVQKQNEIIQQKQIEAETKRMDSQLRSETQIAVAEIGTKSQVLTERMAFVGDLIQKLLDHQHEQGMSAQEHAQSQELTDQQGQQQSAQSAQDAAQTQAQQAQTGE